MFKAKTPQELAQDGKDAGSVLEDARAAAVLSAFKKHRVNLDKIVGELTLIAFSNIKDYVRIDEGGALQAIPLDQIKPQKASRAVRKIKETTKISESNDGSVIFKESKIEYELYDKLASLGKLIELGDYMPAKREEVKHKGVIIVNDPFSEFRGDDDGL